MIMAVASFEKLFRKAASLDVDKNDLKRWSEFADVKLHDLLLMGQIAAKANGRDVIQLYDLPITKGLQESMRAFRSLDVALELAPVLERLARLPALDLGYSAEVEAELPVVLGGLTVALARTFKVLDPEVKNPQSTHWERALAIFDMLL